MIFCKQTIAYWWTIVKSHWFISNVLHGSIYKKNKIVGELLRNTHSIEKGMSLENVRLGFGTLKILAALRLVEEYLKYGELTDEPVMMFLDALDSYLRFHEERNFCNSTIEDIRGRALELNEKREKSPQDSSIVYGGTIMVEHQYYTDQEHTFFQNCSITVTLCAILLMGLLIVKPLERLFNWLCTAPVHVIVRDSVCI